MENHKKTSLQWFYDQLVSAGIIGQLTYVQIQKLGLIMEEAESMEASAQARKYIKGQMDLKKEDEIICRDGLNFKTRAETLDSFVVAENEYKNCNFTASDVWLDAGGNIGAFAVKYANAVKAIHTFEPDRDNYDILVQNVKLNNLQNVYPYNYALVENMDAVRKFYLNKNQNKGSHSFYVKRGRTEVEVNCVNFDKTVAITGANKMKMDVEGAEYDIMINSKTLHQFDEIIFEWHKAALKDKENKMFADLKLKLEKLGFEVNHKEIKQDWHFVVHCIKIQNK